MLHRLNPMGLLESINGPLQDLWLARAGGVRPVGTPQWVGTLKTAPNLRDAEKIEAQGGASEAEGAIGKGDQDPAAVPRMPERDPEPYEPPLGSPWRLARIPGHGRRGRPARVWPYFHDGARPQGRSQSRAAGDEEVRYADDS